jgi:hypothetical protein
VINTYELSGDRDPKDITAADKKAAQATLTDRLCSGQATRPMVAKGVAYRYGYFNKGKFLGSFDVASEELQILHFGVQGVGLHSIWGSIGNDRFDRFTVLASPN